MTQPFPSTMAGLPVTNQGLPVPYVASWSSERWATARMDPLVGKRWAIYSSGRQGRGRPLLGAMNEERQRRATFLRLCQVCARPYGDDGWIVIAGLRPCTTTGGLRHVTHEPPACGPCMEWAYEHCPGIRKVRRQIGGKDPRFHERFFERGLQLVDPAAGPPVYDEWLDGADDPVARQRLSRIGRKQGGLVGYAEFYLPWDAVVIETDSHVSADGSSPEKVFRS